ncbi:spermidine synthase [Serratia marcescens]|jgi:spermidine synthase|uniref:spermidine synthase n=1 Tax=Enterobacterales TaxID=91347 RepID=UPI000744FCA1|nr:spermidine synthase [Serratia marcescens]CVB05295.1 spermidine synthase [Serratia marcescens]
MAIISDFLKGLTLIPKGDIVLHVTDDYGDIIVADSGDYRVLRFEGINEQSKMLKSDVNFPVHNYIRAMLMAVAFTSPHDILVLGLGGGALVRALYALDDRLTLDVVELRERVISVARDCFSLPVSDNISYYIDDAEYYMRKSSTPHYDFIFSDLYSALSMDPIQGSEDFLRSCIKKMRNNSWLVLNYHEIPRSKSPLYYTLHRLFDEVLYCRVPSGNVIIYAAKNPDKYTVNGRRNQAKNILEKIGSDLGYISNKITPLTYF